MKKLIILLLLPLILPVFMYGHIKDERLFKTGNIPPSVMILIDRSGSMDDEVYYYDTTNALQTIVLHDYSGYHDTTIIGWYDNEIFSDGPGNMSWFNNTNADTTWTLKIHSWRRRDSLVVNSWKLRLFHGGTFTDFNGNSFALRTNTRNAHDAINVTGIGTIDSARCYINLSCKDYDYWSWWGKKHWDTYLNHIEVDLEGPSNTDTTVQHTSTRIKEALKVLHSLLDANADGIVDSTDEKYLNVKIGQGYHITAKPYVPINSYEFYSPHKFWNGHSYNEYKSVERYNENTKKWYDINNGYYYLHTDTIGSHFKKIWDDINYTENYGGTPNGHLLKVTIDYYDKWMVSHPDLYCIPKNIILITDGESNTPTTCSNGSKDVVYYAYKAHQDSINVFAVGFGTDITQGGANELNWVAYWGGTDNPSDTNIGDTTKVDPRYGCPVRTPSDYYLSGRAFIASDATALASALSSIINSISEQGQQSYSSGEVTSVQEEFMETNYEARMYLASFKADTTSVWQGNLRAIKLSESSFNIDSIPDSLVIWSAKDTMERTPSDSRKILAIDTSGTMVPFNSSYLTPAQLGVSDNTTRDRIIKRIRDGNVADNWGQLGDIFHSSPLRIHYPNYFYTDQGYTAFYDSVKTRSALIYAGGNDGMLHVFADSVNGTDKGGHEIAGIIPMNFLKKLKVLLSHHAYFVDADPVAADVWLPSDENDNVKNWNEWNTILFACEGEGGRAFTVLDVTDPLGETPHPTDSIKFLFSSDQYSLLADTLGYTTSTPGIFKVRLNWQGHSGQKIDRFLAFLGGGESGDSVMDISLLDSIFNGGEVDGNVIIAIDIWKAVHDTLPEATYFIPPSSRDADKMKYPFPATPALLNIDPQNGNSYDYLFIPDAAGQLWFVDLKHKSDPSEWKAYCIFQPDIPTGSDSSQLGHWHPAFFRPFVWRDPVYGGVWVAYGTGNRSDIFSPSEDRFYAIYYNDSLFADTSVTMPIYHESDLATAGTITIPGNTNGKKGWMVQLSHTAEKVVTQPVYFLDTLKFYTFTPGADPNISPCEIGGQGAQSRIYSFYIRSGGSTNSNGTVTGSGLPQPPRYSYSLGGNGYEIQQNSGNIQIKKISSKISWKEILQWKEKH